MSGNLNYDVLIVLDYYLPGRKAGGPVTTVANMMEALGDDLKFLIVTRRHDIDGTVYSDLEPGRIARMGKADVLYLDGTQQSNLDLLQYARLSGAHTLYLNSFFSPLSLRFLLMKRLGLLKMNVVLAPRGEFSAAAYALKGPKKRIYRYLVDRLGLLNGIRWQVSSEHEEAELRRVLGLREDVMIAPDLFAAQDVPTGTHEGGLVFISRISPKKNLHYALDCLQHVELPVSLDIYGPLEDSVYWAACQAQIRRLPSHITVRYCGTLEYDQVQTTFSRYAAFLFPTLGENYGHVIPEALSAGTPVILSDRTPWQDLEEAGVGWVRSLDQPHTYVEAIQDAVLGTPEQRQERAVRCAAYARAVRTDPEIHPKNLKLFTQPFRRGMP